MTARDVSQIVTAVQEWRRIHAIRLCVLFGSQASGLTHPGSDVDLAIWPTETPDSDTKLLWLVELQDLLGKAVSLTLVSPDLDPVLGMEIVRNGRLIYAIDPELWPKERARLWHTYNDSLPFLRAAREQLRQFAKEIRRES